MKKLGHIALGIAKEELRDLPIRGIEDVIDVLGREKDWDRGQVRGCNFYSSQSPAFHFSALTNEKKKTLFSSYFQDSYGVNTTARILGNGKP